MIKRVPKTEELGDCTIWYDLEIDKEYSLLEFINETKKLDSYANYYIKVRQWAETKIAETVYGKLKILGSINKKVLKAEANGGYGLMSYYITVA